MDTDGYCNPVLQADTKGPNLIGYPFFAHHYVVINQEGDVVVRSIRVGANAAHMHGYYHSP